MSLHFHPLTVKEVKKETTDCVSVLFAIPENLREVFAFAHGQNLTIKKMMDCLLLLPYTSVKELWGSSFKIVLRKWMVACFPRSPMKN